jgi:hypothetical protein
MIVLLDQRLLAHMHKSGIGLADAMERETMFARFAMLRRDGKAIDGDSIESIGVYDLGEDFGVRTVELRYK